MKRHHQRNRRSGSAPPLPEWRSAETIRSSSPLKTLSNSDELKTGKPAERSRSPFKSIKKSRSRILSVNSQTAKSDQYLVCTPQHGTATTTGSTAKSKSPLRVNLDSSGKESPPPSAAHEAELPKQKGKLRGALANVSHLKSKLVKKNRSSISLRHSKSSEFPSGRRDDQRARTSPTSTQQQTSVENAPAEEAVPEGFRKSFLAFNVLSKAQHPSSNKADQHQRTNQNITSSATNIQTRLEKLGKQLFGLKTQVMRVNSLASSVVGQEASVKNWSFAISDLSSTTERVAIRMKRFEDNLQASMKDLDSITSRAELLNKKIKFLCKASQPNIIEATTGLTATTLALISIVVFIFIWCLVNI